MLRCSRVSTLVSVAMCLSLLPSIVQARQVLGWVEWVVLEPSNVRFKAKLDSGAETSSLHATDVEPFERNGEQWVRFHVVLTDHKEELDDDAVTELQMERPVTRDVLIKRHDQESERRYVVTLPFCIAGRQQEAEFTLADRGKWTYPVLLGRRFLEDEVLIDSSDSFLAAAECDWTEPDEVSH